MLIISRSNLLDIVKPIFVRPENFKLLFGAYPFLAICSSIYLTASPTVVIF